MNAAFPAVAAALILLGGCLVTAGIRGIGLRFPGRSLRRGRWRLPSCSVQIRGGVGFAAGAVITLITGIVPAVVLLPVMAVMLPDLLGRIPHPDVELLEALDRWVRLLAAAVATGKSVSDAVRSTRAQAPPALAGVITSFLDRLGARWSVRDALLAMADELDAADADAICAALVLISERGGVGASTTLDALAANIQARLRALREINAERAKPQVVVRQVTLITLCGLVLVMVMSPGYFHPYTTPLGQLLGLGLGACYLGSLVMLRRLALPPRRARILVVSRSEVSHA